MNNIDPTFLWETEALRERRSSTRSSSPEFMTSTVATAATSPEETADGLPGFVSLAEASESTGIPMSTLRKWSRRGAVVSYLDETAEQPVRMVSLDAVRSRAASLGREIPALAASPVVRPRTPEPRVTVDLTGTTAAPAPRAGAGEAAPEPVAASPAAPRHGTADAPGHAPTAADSPTVAAAAAHSEIAAVPPPGTMIVPISAWEKMLNQLGNLHEAGREMAEARERAARAETEAVFLRERLKELRAELATAKDLPAVAAVPAEPGHDAEPGEEAPTPDARAPHLAPREPFEDFLRRTYRNLRKRLRG